MIRLIAIKKETYSDTEISRIITLYSQGVSVHQLEIKYSIDKRKIQNIVDNEGILRTRKESMKYKNINENIFDIIDTKEKAYWLGFLYADGWNDDGRSMVGLKLKISDDNHIMKYIMFMGGNERDIVYLSNDRYPAVQYRIVNKHLSEVLAKYGCMQRKSFKTEFPKWLDRSLQSHFIRGIFEGDGCLTLDKTDWAWACLGTKELLNGIIDILEQETDIKKNIEMRYASETGNNTYNVRKRGNFNVEIICDFLYKEAHTSIILDRKYDLYLQIKKQNAAAHPNRKYVEPPI